VTAVRGLEPKYKDYVKFTIVDMTEKPDSKAEVKGFDLGTHGLVALNAAGEKVDSLPGHNFGQREIVNMIEVVRDL
jgi:hypothetical protein